MFGYSSLYSPFKLVLNQVHIYKSINPELDFKLNTNKFISAVDVHRSAHGEEGWLLDLLHD